MPTSIVGEEVRTQVHALSSEVGVDTAEDVALALVRGAAQGFLEVAAKRGHAAPAARLRLIRALPLERVEIFEATGLLRDS